jgi:hypothetical protein
MAKKKDPGLSEEQTQVKNHFNFQVRQVYRRAFLKAFFDKENEDKAWEVVGARLGKDKRTVHRWQSQEKSRHTKMPDKPDVDTLLLYTVADEKSMFSIPPGRIVGNRAVAETLTEIKKRLPSYADERISANEVALLRFYIENIRDANAQPVSLVLIERLKEQLDFTETPQLSVAKLIDHSRRLHQEWRIPWAILADSLSEYEWFYK